VAIKRIVIDYGKLPEDIINKIKVEYPAGYIENLITFTNSKGRYVSALPLETEDIYYLIRMTELEAAQIVREDNDFGRDGKLREDFLDAIELEDIEPEEEGKIKKEYLDENLDEAENIKDESFED
jgi:DNA-directed RNA polymerase subunit delta